MLNRAFFFLLIQSGLRKMTYLKCPGVASGLTKKTTSSSSSSVSSVNSSLNSSLPISPIGKKGNCFYHIFVPQINFEIAKHFLDFGFGNVVMVFSTFKH